MRTYDTTASQYETYHGEKTHPLRLLREVSATEIHRGVTEESAPRVLRDVSATEAFTEKSPRKVPVPHNKKTAASAAHIRQNKPMK